MARFKLKFSDGVFPAGLGIEDQSYVYINKPNTQKAERDQARQFLRNPDGSLRAVETTEADLDYDAFSIFSPRPFLVDGIQYPTIYHYFQALRMPEALRQQIANMPANRVEDITAINAHVDVQTNILDEQTNQKRTLASYHTYADNSCDVLRMNDSYMAYLLFKAVYTAMNADLPRKLALEQTGNAYFLDQSAPPGELGHALCADSGDITTSHLMGITLLRVRDYFRSPDANRPPTKDQFDLFCKGTDVLPGKDVGYRNMRNICLEQARELQARASARVNGLGSLPIGVVINEYVEYNEQPSKLLEENPILPVPVYPQEIVARRGNPLPPPPPQPGQGMVEIMQGLPQQSVLAVDTAYLGATSFLNLNDEYLNEAIHRVAGANEFVLQALAADEADPNIECRKVVDADGDERFRFYKDKLTTNIDTNDPDKLIVIKSMLEAYKAGTPYMPKLTVPANMVEDWKQACKDLYGDRAGKIIINDKAIDPAVQAQREAEAQRRAQPGQQPANQPPQMPPNFNLPPGMGGGGGRRP